MSFQKYTFDLDFQEEKKKAEELFQKDVDRRTYTDDELLSFKEQSYAEGFEKGHKEALVGIEQQVDESIKILTCKLDNLEEQIQQTSQKALKEALSLCQAIFQKMVPELNEHFVEDTHIEFIERVFSQFLTSTQAQIILHPKVYEAIKKQVESKYENVTFEVDSDLHVQDSVIVWKEGKAIKNFEEVMNEIGHYISSLLNDISALQNDSQNSDLVESKVMTSESEDVKDGEQKTPEGDQQDLVGEVDPTPVNEKNEDSKAISDQEESLSDGSETENSSQETSVEEKSDG